MPRPVRWMAALLAFTFVISLGVLASRMPKTDDDARTDVARTLDWLQCIRQSDEGRMT